MAIVHMGFLGCFLGLVLWASLYDFAFFRIPNVLIAMMMALFVPYAILFLGMGDILYTVVLALGALGVGFGLFSLGILGGGDAKFIPAVILWVGPSQSVNFLILMAIFGGAQALLYLTLRNPIASLSTRVWAGLRVLEDKSPLLRRVWSCSGVGVELGVQADKSQKYIPYGVAIGASVGYLVYHMIKSIAV